MKRVKELLKPNDKSGAYKGYYIKHNPFQDEYHVSKEGHHVTTQKTHDAAKKAIDEITG